MAGNLAPVLKHKFTDANGNPLAGGKLYSYVAGTTTPQATYTDSTQGSANTNPIILDASGEASIWLDPSLSYKFTLTNSSDNQQWTVDNVVGLLSTDSVVTDSIQDEAVTEPKLADNSVPARVLSSSADTDADRAVTTNHIRDSAINTSKMANEAITQAKKAIRTVTTDGSDPGAGGVCVTAGSGNYERTSSSEGNVTNLSGTLTTLGNPVVFKLVSDPGGASDAFIGIAPSGGSTSATGYIVVTRNGTTIYQSQIAIAGDTDVKNEVPPGAVSGIDYDVDSGSHTYVVRAAILIGNATISVRYCRLVLHEM